MEIYADFTFIFSAWGLNKHGKIFAIILYQHWNLRNNDYIEMNVYITTILKTMHLF